MDDSLIAPLEHMAVPVQFTDVETVIKNVRQSCTVKAGLAVAENMTFAGESVGKAFEGMAA
nr:hypothetical protein [Symmachiella dynata]